MLLRRGLASIKPKLLSQRLSSSSSSSSSFFPSSLSFSNIRFFSEDYHGVTERKTITLTFTDRFGHSETYDDIRVGQNLLEECWRKGIPIPGECTGQHLNPDDTIHFGEGAQCTKCYVRVPPNYLEHLEPRLRSEEYQLERIPNSDETYRCSCKIWLTPDHNNMVVGLPLYSGEIDVNPNWEHEYRQERRHH